MSRLPSQLTYNDLNGSEAIETILDWVRQLLTSQPELKPHLTLPMADISISLRVGIDMYIGGTVPVGSPPEHMDIAGGVTVSNRLSGEPSAQQPSVQVPVHVDRDLSARVNAAPIPGGQVPDQVRAQHGLPTPRPGYGPRDTGSHLFLADIAQATNDASDASASASRTSASASRDSRKSDDARQGIVADGYQFAEGPGVSVVQPSAAGLEQTIPLAKGRIDIDLSGEGKMRQGGTVVTAGTHNASKKVFGDQAGAEYGSVSGTYDAGPAGLARPGRAGGGLYSDGRSRISFGNTNRQ